MPETFLSQAEVDTIRDLHRQGMRYKDIAARMGISPSSAHRIATQPITVRSLLRRLALRRTDDDDRAALEAINDAIEADFLREYQRYGPRPFDRFNLRVAPEPRMLGNNPYIHVPGLP